jgi:hypothetical protein
MITNGQNPSPQSTLVILLGAATWPDCRELEDSDAYSNAAQQLRAYLASPLFGLPSDHLLDLFNANTHASDHYLRVEQFLQERIKPRSNDSPVISDLLIYFIGHGQSVGRQAQLYLAIRTTRESSWSASALQMQTLAATLKEFARYLRLYLILDCCFAGAAMRDLIQGDELQAIKTSVDDAFLHHDYIAQKGLAFLGSSDHNTVSRVLPDKSCTTFSWAFFDALTSGKVDGHAYISLRDG